MQQSTTTSFVTTTQDDLKSLAGRINESDPLAAQRLTMLSEALANQSASGSSTGPSTTSWASRNVHEIIDIDTITERVREQGSNLAINWLELIRNVLIILPLTLTWFGISQAVNDYRTLLESDPNLATQPFIFLWERQFGGRLPAFLTLSSLALGDFLLLFLIFGLTFFVSWQQGIKESQREQDAVRLRSELADALARAALCLGERQLDQPTDFVSVVMRLDQVTQQTATRLNDVTVQVNTVVQQFLVELQEERKQRGSLSDFLQGLEAITNKMLTGASTIQNATTVLSTSLDTLTPPLKEISVQQKGLLQKAQDTFTQFEPVANDLRQLTTEQQDFNQDLHHSLGQLLTQQKQFSQELTDAVETLNISQTQIVKLIEQVQRATDHQENVIQTLEKEHQAQISMVHYIRDVANEMKEALKAVQAVTPELHSATVDMSKFALTLRTIPAALKAELVDPLRDYSKGADRMVNAAVIIEQAGQELQNAALRLQSSPSGQRP
jgi:hypothetical protein